MRSPTSLGQRKKRRRITNTATRMIRRKSPTFRVCRESSTRRFLFRLFKPRPKPPFSTSMFTRFAIFTPMEASIRPVISISGWAIHEATGRETLSSSMSRISTSGLGSTMWAISTVMRYTPIYPNHIDYEATIEDPKVFTKPWKIDVILYRHAEKNCQLLDYERYAFDYEKILPVGGCRPIGARTTAGIALLQKEPNSNTRADPQMVPKREGSMKERSLSLTKATWLMTVKLFSGATVG
jgi:hypothetical protein